MTAPLIDRLMADEDFLAARQLVAEAWAARDPDQAQTALDMQRVELHRVAHTTVCTGQA